MLVLKFKEAMEFSTRKFNRCPGLCDVKCRYQKTISLRWTNLSELEIFFDFSISASRGQTSKFSRQREKQKRAMTNQKRSMNNINKSNTITAPLQSIEERVTNRIPIKST